MTENLEDIIEELADKIGVYGACRVTVDDDARKLTCHCRACFVVMLRARIEAAVEVDRKLAQ